MVLDRACPCPTDLLLERVRHSLEQLQIDRSSSDSSQDSSPCPGPRRNRKKKRAVTDVKSFHQLYQSTGEVLGEGAFGSVETYTSVLTGKLVAVKRIKIDTGRRRQKVLKEIELYHHCAGHANILQLIEVFEEGDVFYMVLERMAGGALLELIQHRGSLTEREAAQVTRDIASALHFLHNKGIAHRDLKPDNILCPLEDQVTGVKICDFDLGSRASTGEGDSSPELHSPVGSAEYMAPEVVEVWQDQAWSYTKACDLWSLGVILYILLCGYTPFCGNCGRDCEWETGQPCPDCQESLFDAIMEGDFAFHDEHWEGISEGARDLIHHLLVVDPARRYNAAEVLAHPWLNEQCSLHTLNTPSVLKRHKSVKQLDCFVERANSMSHAIMQQLSITDVRQPVDLSDSSDLEGNSLYSTNSA